MTVNAATVLAALQERGQYLAIAESLTGGLLAAEFISVPGASNVVLGSITAYQNSLKQNLLAVPVNVLQSRGAVSSETAEAMAVGVREQLAHAAGVPLDKVIGIATTGVAGPDADGDKPVGLVYLGYALPGGVVRSVELRLKGDRAKIRAEAVASAVSELWEQIAK